MESEDWGRRLELLHPEMETFQVIYITTFPLNMRNKLWCQNFGVLKFFVVLQTLCAECGQRLSEVELRASGLPPVANRVVMLTQQLEELREFEAGLVVVGNVLERVIGTQKKIMQVRRFGWCTVTVCCVYISFSHTPHTLTRSPHTYNIVHGYYICAHTHTPHSPHAPHTHQLGAKVASELAELVRRFHERWVEVKKKVTNRYAAIDKAMVKYDPENLGVASELGVNVIQYFKFSELGVNLIQYFKFSELGVNLIQYFKFSELGVKSIQYLYMYM